VAVKVSIISVGKVKDKYIELGINEFKKRLSRFCKLSIQVLKDESIPENVSEKEQILIKEKEGSLILNSIPKDSFLVVMDIDGKHLSSMELASEFNRIFNYHSSHIVFVIGGSLGISDRIKRMADLKLSFSHLTFPHQLFKLIMLEQIYRCFKINANESYHK